MTGKPEQKSCVGTGLRCEARIYIWVALSFFPTIRNFREVEVGIFDITRVASSSLGTIQLQISTQSHIKKNLATLPWSAVPQTNCTMQICGQRSGHNLRTTSGRKRRSGKEEEEEEAVRGLLASNNIPVLTCRESLAPLSPAHLISSRLVSLSVCDDKGGGDVKTCHSQGTGRERGQSGHIAARERQSGHSQNSRSSERGVPRDRVPGGKAFFRVFLNFLEMKKDVSSFSSDFQLYKMFLKKKQLFSADLNAMKSM